MAVIARITYHLFNKYMLKRLIHEFKKYVVKHLLNISKSVHLKYVCEKATNRNESFQHFDTI